MGAGGLSGFGGEQHQSQQQRSTAGESAGSMGSSCDHCGIKFGLFSKKRQCSECHTLFCSTCARRGGLIPNSNASTSTFRSSGDRTCSRCRILLTRPPVRAELMTLRVKDLQRYLVDKQVNTKACVEKKDLVELVIRANGGASITSPTGNSNSAVRGRDPIERQKSFPKNYSESRHRSEWFESHASADQEDVSSGSPPDIDDFVRDFVVVDRPENEETRPAEVEQRTEETPVEDINLNEANCDERGNDDDQNRRGEDDAPAAAAAASIAPQVTTTTTSSSSSGPSSSSSTSASSSSASTPSHPPQTAAAEASSEEPVPMTDDAVAPESEPVSLTPRTASQPIPTPGASSLPNATEAWSSSQTAKGASASPRRFANQGLVYIEELTSESDLDELSVKQIKEVLAMNRVNFKGVVEKDELLRILRRLWADHEVLTKEKDAMEDTDLCKICMDNPVDCVMLECGHMCTCTNCGKQMAECPICRQYVVRVVRTFKS